MYDTKTTQRTLEHVPLARAHDELIQSRSVDAQPSSLLIDCTSLFCEVSFVRGEMQNVRVFVCRAHGHLVLGTNVRKFRKTAIAQARCTRRLGDSEARNTKLNSDWQSSCFVRRKTMCTDRSEVGWLLLMLG